MDPWHSGQDLIRCDFCEALVPPLHFDLCHINFTTNEPFFPHGIASNSQGEISLQIASAKSLQQTDKYAVSTS